MTSETFETILVTRDDRVATITLNRPKALNALNSELMHAVVDAVPDMRQQEADRAHHRVGIVGGDFPGIGVGFLPGVLDADPSVGAIIITGSEKAFAAGADIKEMASLTFADVFSQDFFALWNKFAATRTPPSCQLL